MTGLKELALKVVTWPGVTLPFEPLMHDSATIFMLHRFANEETGSSGMNPGAVRKGLEYLRSRKYELVSLGEIFRRMSEGVPLKGCVGFTIDDGYLDHATVAAPLFASLDCPVTTFIATGFLDRQLWLWWDIIEHIVQHSGLSAIRLDVAGRELSYSLDTPGSRTHAEADIVRTCKLLPDKAKLDAIAQLAGAARVEVPDQPPPKYGPMSWDQARACERKGMSFGAHTVTHPILARTDDDQSRREIEESWARVRQELTAPVPVFCYPNGELTDFSSREIATLRQLGLVGAVVGMPGHATGRDFAASEESPFKVRRFSFPTSVPKIVQYASGLERFKSLVRGGY